VKVNSSEINKTKASLINIFFNYGTTLVLIINSIFLVPFYLNYMSLSDYGAWLTAIAAINIVMLIDPGISSVSSQRMSKSFSEDSDKDFQGFFLSSFMLAMLFSIFTLFIGFMLASYALDLLDYEDQNRIVELNKAIKIYIVAISLVPIYSILSSFLQALLQTFKDNSINFISIVTSPFVIVIGLMNDLGIVSLALGIFVPNLIRIILYIPVVLLLWQRYVEERVINFSNSRALLLFKDIKFLYLRKFSSITSENIETAVAGIFFSTEIAAFISIIKRLFVAIQMFSTGIAVSTYTSLSHAFSVNNQSSLRNAIDKTIYSFQLVHLFGTSLILASVGPLIFIWLKEDLFFDYSFILMMALNVFLLAKLNLFNTILYTSGDYKSVAYISIVESLLRISLTYVLIISLDIYGLPMAGILSSIIALIFIVRLIQEKSGGNKFELLYPGTAYELVIYFFASLVGFYHTAQEGFLQNSFNIVLVTFVLFCLLIFSKKVRSLGQTIFNTLK